MASDQGNDLRQLCRERDQALEAFRAAEGLVALKLAAVFTDRGACPTEEDLSAAERAEERLKELEAQIHALLERQVS